VRDAAFGCDWMGIPIPFQRCLMFIIATANKEFKLTAGKFVPVSNLTAMNVCMCTMYACKSYVSVFERIYVTFRAIHENVHFLQTLNLNKTEENKED
jgi:hypothetical protein